MVSAADFIAWFAGDSRERGPRAIVIVAHPDDETIGAGSRLGRLAPVALVHVTDGAPRDPWFARAAGCADRAGYAALRRKELEAALAAGDVAAPVRTLGAVDQEAALDLAGLTAQVRELLDELGPEVVLTHAYEGGHPDHDATAFAVHAARRRGEVILELASYHEGADGTVFGRFAGGDGRAVPLDDVERARKRAMLDCFRSQAPVLRQFPVDAEWIRLAPRYDFAAPPPGVAGCHYDRFGWAMTGRRFRELASDFQSEMKTNSGGTRSR